MAGPNAACDEATCALTNALGQLSLQITHETTAARECQNAAVGTVTVIESLLQDALGICNVVKARRRIAQELLRFLLDR